MLLLYKPLRLAAWGSKVNEFTYSSTWNSTTDPACVCEADPMPTPRCVLIRKWCATSVTDSLYLVLSLGEIWQWCWGIGSAGLRYVGGGRAPEWGNDWSDWLLATGRLARVWNGWTLRRAYWSCGFATEASSDEPCLCDLKQSMWLVWFV